MIKKITAMCIIFKNFFVSLQPYDDKDAQKKYKKQEY